MNFLKTTLFCLAIATGALSAVAFYPEPDNPDKERLILSTTLNALTGLHYNPIELNGTFLKDVFEEYIERVDASKRFFLKQEVAELLRPHVEPGADLEDVAYDYFNRVEERFPQALERSEAIFEEVLAEPFDFTVEESVELDGEEVPYASSEAELRERWRKLLKWETLTRLDDKLEQQKKLRAAEDAPKEDEEDAEAAELDEEAMQLKDMSYAELEADARADVLKIFSDWYERMRKLKRSDRLSDFLNVITGLYDPHTGYFAPIDKDNFDINMSGKLEGIGARLQTDGDYTKVSSIVAGGPAWKVKEIDENDVILKVKQEGEEPVDIGGLNINEVVQLIRGPKGTKVTLTVRKVDGTLKDVEIVRDVVVLEEGFAKSLILDTEQGEKIGYILLPRFYADFKDKKGRSSFRDIRTEVEKVKAEGVSGIILDLRSNGGGSLRDVVDMTGLFIEDGPVVQVKGRNSAPEMLEDDDRSVQYDGPLVVMVNEFSASASEILAAALQDYGRAVIVGNKTFGKGTVQRFVDLDRALHGRSEFKPLGSLKATTQKFYRINGGSTQLEGVTPDIFLPDSYAYIETGERENEHALPWDKIEAADYEDVSQYTKHLSEVRRLSKLRTSLDTSFQYIDEYARGLSRERDETTVGLSLSDYQTAQRDRTAASDRYKNLFQPIEGLEVKNLLVDQEELVGADEGKVERNKNFVERVQKDLHLYEALNILNDMIRLDEGVAVRKK